MNGGDVGVLVDGTIYPLSIAVRSDEELWNMIEEHLNKTGKTLVIMSEEK